VTGSGSGRRTAAFRRKGKVCRPGARAPVTRRREKKGKAAAGSGEEASTRSVVLSMKELGAQGREERSASAAAAGSGESAA
jgi:hypothetical protein